MLWKPGVLALLLLLGTIPAYFWLVNEFIYPVMTLPIPSRQFFALTSIFIFVPIALLFVLMGRAMWQSGLTQGAFALAAILWLLGLVFSMALGLLDDVSLAIILSLTLGPPTIVGLGGILFDYLRVVVHHR